MPNMSYCRFENTSNDIRDCIEALDELDWDLKKAIADASCVNEARGIKRFVEMCREVADGLEGEEI